jgi:hypothetical protein
LLNLTIDLNGAGTITLVFDETVDVLNSFASTFLTIQNAETAPTASLSLSGADVQTVVNGTSVTFTFVKADLEILKSTTSLGVSRDTTWFNFDAGLIADMVGNRVVPGVMKVDAFTEDTTAPELLWYDFDASFMEMTLSFTETIKVSSFNIDALSIQNVVTVDYIASVQENFRFPTSTLTTTSDSMLLTVRMSFSDANALRERISPPYAKSQSSTFLTVNTSFVTDMNSQSVVAISHTNAKNARNFTDDVIPPKLFSFAMNLNTGVLKLFFDESVNAGSFVYNKVIFQSTVNTTAPTYKSVSLTTGGNVLSSNDDTLVVQLSKVDLNSIKRQSLCARGATGADCFIVLGANSIQDMHQVSYKVC